MSESTEPMDLDPPRDPARPWAPSPFARLARAHALSVAGDAVFTAAMAGLVFFSVTKLDQARWQVAAALLFTIVPFSLAAPFIGPLIDRARGGRKWMIVGLCALRAVVCLALAWNRQNQLVLYPLFTLVLVFAQGYILARGALVPATVRNDSELVKANAKLAAVSGVAAVVGGAASLLVMWLVNLLELGDGLGPSVALGLAAVVYAAAGTHAAQLPPVQVAPTPPDEAETAELHGAGIQAAAVALSVVRVVVGFTTFLLAFHFKDLEEVDPWGSRVGLVGCVVLAQLGFLLGSAAATRVRRAIVEEQIVVAALAVIGVAGLLSAVMTELWGALTVAFAVGLASNSAKQAFDAVVQRDAPDANRGRAFARFETRFQLFWVVGALVPVAATTRPALGELAVGIAGAGGALWFALARRRLRSAARRPPVPAGEPTLVEPRPISRAFLRRRRYEPVTVEETELLAAMPPPVDRTEPIVPVPAADRTEPIVAVTVADPTGEGAPGAVEATIEMAAVAEDRTAVWAAPPGPAPAPEPVEAPWSGTLPRTEPFDHPILPFDRPPVPRDDDELASPSEAAAWFQRDDEPRAAASEAWGTIRRRPGRWDDPPGDPDDRR